MLDNRWVRDREGSKMREVRIKVFLCCFGFLGGGVLAFCFGNGLAKLFRLTWNLQSSCLSLPGAEITGCVTMTKFFFCFLNGKRSARGLEKVREIKD
jgi:hypothetical protein